MCGYNNATVITDETDHRTGHNVSPLLVLKV